MSQYPNQMPQGYQPQPTQPQYGGYPQQPQQPPQQWHPPQIPQQGPPPGYAPNPVQQPGGMNPLAGMFTGIQNARPSMNRDFLRPGRYWLKIDTCRVGQKRNMIPFACADFVVIAVLDNDNGLGHRVGDEVSFFCGKDQPEIFLREIQNFVGGTMEIEPTSLTELDCMEVFGPGQPLRGTVVESIGRTKVTKTGKQLTTTKFQREVPPAELLNCLPDDLVQRFWPDGALARMAQHGQPAPAAQPPMQQPPQQAPSSQPAQQPWANPQQPPMQWPPRQ